MSHSFIYLVLPINESFFKQKELVSLFVSGASDYLSQFSFKGQTYWGKKLPAPIAIETLESTGCHILSLISKVEAAHTFTLDDLVVFGEELA